jgi:hypothetical protein
MPIRRRSFGSVSGIWQLPAFDMAIVGYRSFSSERVGRWEKRECTGFTPRRV